MAVELEQLLLKVAVEPELLKMAVEPQQLLKVAGGWGCPT